MDGGYLCIAKQWSQNSGEKSYIKLIKAPEIIFKLYRQTFNLRWLKVAWGLVWNSIYWVCYIFRILWSCKNFWVDVFYLFLAFSEQLWMVGNIDIYQRAGSSLKTFFLECKALDSHAFKNQTFFSPVRHFPWSVSLKTGDLRLVITYYS